MYTMIYLEVLVRSFNFLRSPSIFHFQTLLEHRSTLILTSFCSVNSPVAKFLSLPNPKVAEDFPNGF